MSLSAACSLAQNLAQEGPSRVFLPVVEAVGLPVQVLPVSAQLPRLAEKFLGEYYDLLLTKHRLSKQFGNAHLFEN